ncbi:NADPH:quinone reductase [Pseudonocardia thermophila]|jgi:NADPH:quinone reductase and related Zn-dependent oxidoreductases|uniref:NADPH:quinone reductase n=1 Tax=Pseudonocardia thermophila TaxID=1848 RepID=A0A1M6QEH1_PSETH|nr:NADP-dependent oxidoreductase [Pseudonocardia thermophila]SHK18659.1 NADPH:quinone reductase [Pseudonocardia thermophila]
MSDTNTMQVVEATRIGGPEVLRPARRPIPQPAPTEVLVRVRAAAINPVDWKTRSGSGMAGVLGPAPWVLGWDVAGEVVAVGFGVTRFAVGDRVLGMPHFPREAGGYGEYVAAPSLQFARIPDGVDDAAAAGLPLAGLTALQSFRAAGLEKGQRVLVHAAAGGVGHLAVQLAKARGAYVIGTASAAKHAFVEELGADEVIDYRERPFEEQVRDVDIVLDTIGGTNTRRSARVLRPGGVLVDIPGGDVPDDAAVRVIRPLVEPDGAGLDELVALMATGELRVHVAETAPLAEVARLHELGEQGRTTGKLVLTL